LTIIHKTIKKHVQNIPFILTNTYTILTGKESKVQYMS